MLASNSSSIFAKCIIGWYLYSLSSPSTQNVVLICQKHIQLLGVASPSTFLFIKYAVSTTLMNGWVPDYILLVKQLILQYDRYDLR